MKKSQFLLYFFMTLMACPKADAILSIKKITEKTKSTMQSIGTGAKKVAQANEELNQKMEDYNENPNSDALGIEKATERWRTNIQNTKNNLINTKNNLAHSMDNFKKSLATTRDSLRVSVKGLLRHFDHEQLLKQGMENKALIEIFAYKLIDYGDPENIESINKFCTELKNPNNNEETLCAILREASLYEAKKELPTLEGKKKPKFEDLKACPIEFADKELRKKITGSYTGDLDPRVTGRVLAGFEILARGCAEQNKDFKKKYESNNSPKNCKKMIKKLQYTNNAKPSDNID